MEWNTSIVNVMEYYYCKGYYFDDEFILCKECSKWLDDVETTIEKHLTEFIQTSS
jgi:hypothetical protein